MELQTYKQSHKHYKINTNTNSLKIIQSPSGVNSNSGNKLRTYAKLKTDYELEKYLTVDLSQNMMREIARLRTSTHKPSDRNRQIPETGCAK